MRSFALSLGALAIVAMALPVVQAANADDETVVVKHGHHHHDWDHHDWDRHHYHKKIVIKHEHHD